MSIVQAYTEAYRNYLFDESRTMGRADYIAFPRNEAELVEAVRFARDNHVPLTAQGARTGLAGGASPQGGMILNLSRMNRILGIRRDEAGRFLLRVQPGVALTTVRKALKNKSFDVSGWDEESRETLKDVRAGALFFSPDPTEPTASIGGMASCNACGARSFLYGCTRKHVNALRAVLADGRVTQLMRGRERARGREFELPCTDGSVVRGRLPDFDTPDIKDAGYLLRADMELIDLFLGSQGTLGVISELELILLPSPALLCGVTAFFPDDENALQYVYAMKKFEPKPASIEFFDKRALDLVEAQKAETPAFRQLQPLPENYCCAVYVEFNLDDKGGLCPVLEKLAPVIAQSGGDADNTWVARDELELEKLLLFRHSVPETIDIHVEKNKKNEPEITILSTDMAVDDAHFDALFHLYKRDLEASGLPCLIFGHIGENHVHPNVLARNLDEYRRGHALFEKWARDVSDMGGTITAEHGAGKIKRKLALIMYGEEKMRKLWALKRQLDPENILGPGNVLTEVER